MHPAVPGVVVHGTAAAAWLGGEHFLTLRTRTDHPELRGALAVLGHMGHNRVGTGASPGAADAGGGPLRMHSVDTRRVSRLDDTGLASSWRCWRDAPSFSRRWADGGATIVSPSPLCGADGHWAEDLQITHRRQR